MHGKTIDRPGENWINGTPLRNFRAKIGKQIGGGDKQPPGLHPLSCPGDTIKCVIGSTVAACALFRQMARIFGSMELERSGTHAFGYRGAARTNPSRSRAVSQRRRPTTFRHVFFRQNFQQLSN